ncbi:class I SAM-dependent methyltransferase [Priestia koreensis]|uniref:class I SAM-dependent methyltransferase n=1 Tax=Priestia koreensis TaxID=284581 RepID=UPI0028F6D39C|nr:class I SAM-dependent methyltransferase [Priestia koreensis]
MQDNLEKYADPKQYDYLHRVVLQDVEMIKDYADRCKGPILELACGTGRATIPLAKQGHTVIGVDLHAGMLERAKEKATRERVNASFYQQDCTMLNLPVQASMVFMIGNSFQHFLTNKDQDHLLAGVKNHLKPGGLFIFDTRNPVFQDLAVPDRYEVRDTNVYSQEILEKHEEMYDHATQILTCETIRFVYEQDEVVKEEKDRIKLRYTYPLELERLLSQHNFQMVECYGDWMKREFTAQSPQMIVVCKLGES